MTQFIINHPFTSIIIFAFIAIYFAITVNATASVIKEGIKRKVKRLKEKINELKAYISDMEDMNSKLSVDSIHQRIEIEDLKDKLKDAKLGLKVLPFVEDMAGECAIWLKENLQLKSALKVKSKRCEEIDQAFRIASKELNALQKAEKENEDWRTLYKQAMKENEELKERAKHLQETIEHRKHTKSQPKETKFWTPKKDIQDWFTVGNVYEECNRTDGMFSLYLEINGTKQGYVVNKSDFTIAEKPVEKVQQ